MRVHLLVNLYRPDAVTAAEKAVVWLKGEGIEYAADREPAALIEVPHVSDEKFGEADLAIAIGGDGTLIRTAHLVSSNQTPILGVQYGRFGFVTQVQPADFQTSLEAFIDGKCEIDERMMIRTELIREGKVVAGLESLNETVVQRSAATRMLTFEVYVNGKILSRYPADGVMVATPTGSTAYNLSAGGPVVDPGLQALLLTAIMPHTLSARPLLLRPDSELEIKVESREDAVLSCDGHSRLHLLSGDYVRITRSEKKTRLVCMQGNDFFDKLAHRLQWSQGKI